MSCWYMLIAWIKNNISNHIKPLGVPSFFHVPNLFCSASCFSRRRISSLTITGVAWLWFGHVDPTFNERNLKLRTPWFICVVENRLVTISYYHGNPQPSFLGVITHILGCKTFIFHGFGVPGYPLYSFIVILYLIHLIAWWPMMQKLDFEPNQLFFFHLRWDILGAS